MTLQSRVIKDLTIFALIVVAVSVAVAGPLDEMRYCGPPKRDVTGKIIRDPKVTRRFQLLHPCPESGRVTGACPGWAIDHVIPLACGGCDAVFNMQWLDTVTKRRKDSFERNIDAATPPIADTATCRLRPVSP
jgi:hypothetical protein